MVAPHLRFYFISGPAGWNGEGRDHKAKEGGREEAGLATFDLPSSSTEECGKEKKRRKTRMCERRQVHRSPPLAQTPLPLTK